MQARLWKGESDLGDVECDHGHDSVLGWKFDLLAPNPLNVGDEIRLVFEAKERRGKVTGCLSYKRAGTGLAFRCTVAKAD